MQQIRVVILKKVRQAWRHNRVMKAFYSDHFVLPLPEGHRFPMAKYRLLRDRLLATLPQVCLSEAPRASDGELAMVHDPAYVASLKDGTIDPAMVRAIGFPWSEAMVERSRRSVGATIAAARMATRARSARRGQAAKEVGFHRVDHRTDGGDLAMAANATKPEFRAAQAGCLLHCSSRVASGRRAGYRPGARIRKAASRAPVS